MECSFNVQMFHGTSSSYCINDVELLPVMVQYTIVRCTVYSCTVQKLIEKRAMDKNECTRKTKDRNE